MSPDSEQLHKQINMNMIIINSLRLFNTTLTSAVQRWDGRTFSLGGNSADGNLMLYLCLCWRVFRRSSFEKEGARSVICR